MELVEINALSLNRPQAILKQLDLTLSAGRLTMLVGPNGAGKSSLIQCLAGILSPSAGSIRIQQQEVKAWQPWQWAQQVSFLPQHSNVNFALTVAEVVRLGGLSQSYSREQLDALTLEALALWQLTHYAEREVRCLSGGEQQRCQLARSWLQMQAPATKLWLLDEPLAALDLHHQRLCLEQARNLSTQGKAVLMAVHDLNLARLCADQVWLLAAGELVASGEATTVLSAANVSRVFQVPARVENGYLHYF